MTDTERIYRATALASIPAGSVALVEVNALGVAVIKALPPADVVVNDGEAARPCPEGFHWIGQGFDACEECALPAWDHEGMAVPNVTPAGPFDSDGHVLRKWRDGEREACARKWEPALLDRLERNPAPADRCDPYRNRHRQPHIGCTLTDKDDHGK